jgi:hypothetical protein
MSLFRKSAEEAGNFVTLKPGLNPFFLNEYTVEKGGAYGDQIKFSFVHPESTDTKQTWWLPYPNPKKVTKSGMQNMFGHFIQHIQYIVEQYVGADKASAQMDKVDTNWDKKKVEVDFTDRDSVWAACDFFQEHMLKILPADYNTVLIQVLLHYVPGKGEYLGKFFLNMPKLAANEFNIPFGLAPVVAVDPDTLVKPVTEEGETPQVEDEEPERPDDGLGNEEAPATEDAADDNW